MTAIEQEERRDEIIEQLNANERRTKQHIRDAFVELEVYLEPGPGLDLARRIEKAYVVAIEEGMNLARETVSAATLIDTKLEQLFGSMYREA